MTAPDAQATEMRGGDRLSDEQLAAVDPGADVWVSASAGTGKTHVLVGRVLRLMLAGAHPESILCLTYTRAAAAEMRNRLLARLSAFAAAPERELKAALAGLLGRAPGPDECARARRLLLQVLELPEGLKIETMHAFCQSLLARFPLEAGLAPHFRVVEEAESRLIFEEALNQVFTEARQDPPLQDALAQLATTFADDRLAERLALAVAERHRILDALAGRSTEGHMRALASLLDIPVEADHEALITAFFETGAVPANTLHEWASALCTGKKTLQKAAEAITAYLALGNAPAPARLAAYERIFLTARGEPGSRVQDQIARNFPDMREAWREATDALLGLLEQLKAVLVHRLTAAWLAVARRLIAVYEERKAARGVLDFADLVHRARRLLETPGIAPWVLYKLDRRIAHVLVDEAQDSNAQQWALIAALMEERFSGRGAERDEEAPAGTLFAVGDVKQSIYRFQGAEPESFLAARADFRRRAEDARRRFRALALSRSFRSAPEILAFVDAVFADEEGRALLGLRDEDVRHEAHRRNVRGLVELWAPEGPAEEEDEKADEDGRAWTPPETIARKDDPADRLAHRIAARIAAMLEGGELLESENRPIAAGDILVLVRRRDRLVDLLIAALRARGVPVAGVDRLVVTESLAVQDLVAAARFALLPEDDLNLAALLKSPLIGLADEDLIAFAPGRGGSLWEAFRAWADRTGRGDLRERLEGWLKRADTGPPHAFFSHILFAEGGLRRLAGRLGAEILDPVAEFLARARAFADEGPPSLQHLLAWLARARQEIKRDLEEGRDEVRVMTIHGAKGLEAPIVFLPDTFSEPQEHRDRNLAVIPGAGGADDPVLALLPASGKALPGPLQAPDAERIAREREEYWRLLYVALTRARDRLYIAGWHGRQKREGCWYERLRETMCALLGEAPDGVWDVLRHPVDWAPLKAPRVTPGTAPQEAAAPEWAARPPRDAASGRRVLAPSRAEDEDRASDAMPPLSPRAAGRRGAIARGRLLHLLLQHLPELPADRRWEAADRFLARQAPALTPDERARLIAELRGVLEDPAFAPLFTPAARAEVPLAGVLAGRPVTGRVDRLLVTAERILVVDYKGMRPAPSTVAEVPRAYLRQMALYRALLRRAFPDRPVEAALLWTAVPRLMPLPDALLDAAAPAALRTDA